MCYVTNPQKRNGSTIHLFHFFVIFPDTLLTHLGSVIAGIRYYTSRVKFEDALPHKYEVSQYDDHVFKHAPMTFNANFNTELVTYDYWTQHRVN
jgi:hypothetical protein